MCSDISRRSLLCGTVTAIASAGLGWRATASAQTSADPLASPRFGAWGLDLAGMDRSVAPGADFYQFTNGGWMRETQIPDDRANVGMFYTLRELVEARVRAIIEAAAAHPQNETQGQVGALYLSYMDEGRIEQSDDEPLRPAIAEIAAARNRRQLARLHGRCAYRNGASLFDFGVGPDDREPSRNVVNGKLGSLGLPDREYYLAEGFAEQRARYRQYVQQLLELADWPNPAAAADAILAYETELAREHWPIADLRDPIRTYNPTTFDDLSRDARTYPWADFLDGAGLSHWRGKVVVTQASAIAPVAAIFARTPLSTLKAWAVAQLVDQSAPLLSPRFDEANFDFRERFMQGQPAQRPRWRRGVGLVNSSLAHAVGRTYADTYFTPATKAKIDELVANLIAAMRRRIENLPWMSAATKTQALDKLSKFRANIGYPRSYRDFTGLVVEAGDLYGNVERIQEFNWRWLVGKLQRPVDRAEWSDTPQTVNAYNRSTQNDITFPAGILQAPFFDPDADLAINYGAIGAVIGHEISHGFDDQGRMTDGDGVLRDWWATEDGQQFQTRADRFVTQLNAYEPLPGARVNGRLALGESIADLAGLTIGLEAYRQAVSGATPPLLDGFTGEQRVFLGWAQAWRTKYREAFLRQLIATNEHPPGFVRVNGVMRNIDGWYEAFNISERDPLYLPPEQRVRIW